MKVNDGIYSGFTVTDLSEEGNRFTSFQEIPSTGFCRLVKAKRYGRWYVLKFLRKEFSSDTFFRQMLHKEFSIAVMMSHKNIVTVYGLEMVEDFGECIIYEYIVGVTLDRFIHSGAGKKSRQKIAAELIDAVMYINSFQIVHRDLKPSNIMVTDNGTNLKIIDFGLSDSDSYDILKEPAGTCGYMSPEQKVSYVPDCGNDLYSLGILLRELKAGWVYDFVGSRCIGPKRLKFADDAARLVRNLKKTLLVMSVLLYTIVLFFASYGMMYMFVNNDKRKIEDAITEINEFVDKSTEKMLHSLDSLCLCNPEMDKIQYNLLSSKYIFGNYNRVHEKIRSVTKGMNDSDSAVVVSAVWNRWQEKNVITDYTERKFGELH